MTDRRRCGPGNNHSLHVWHLRGTHLRELWSVPSAHAAAVSCVTWGRGRSAAFLFSGGWDRVIKVRGTGRLGSARSAQPAFLIATRHPHPAAFARARRCGQQIRTLGCRWRSCMCVRPPRRAVVLPALLTASRCCLRAPPLPSSQGHEARLTQLDVVTRGDYLLSASADFTVRLWDTQAPHACVCVYSHSEAGAYPALPPPACLRAARAELASRQLPPCLPARKASSPGPTMAWSGACSLRRRAPPSCLALTCARPRQPVAGPRGQQRRRVRAV